MKTEASFKEQFTPEGDAEGDIITDVVADIHIKEAAGKHLAYTKEFKKFISGHPGFIRDTLGSIYAIDAHAEGDGENKKRIIGDFSESDLGKVTLIDRNFDRTMYKVEELNSQESFFVKRAPYQKRVAEGKYAPREYELGFEEFLDTSELERKVTDVPWVEVQKYMCGFRDDQWTYYVAKWDDRLQQTVAEIRSRAERALRTYQKRENKDEYVLKKVSDIEAFLYNLNRKVERLQEILGPEYDDDFGANNLAYDFKKEKIIVFDTPKVRSGPSN